MIRSIIIASLSIPALILTIFSGVGVIFLLSSLLSGSGYNEGWFGMVYAGLVYSYFAVLISSIPTLILGFPAALLAKKYNALNTTVILLGSTLLGSLFLSLGVAIYIKPFTIEFFWWSMLVGALGGLFNGYIFISRLKHNNALNSDAAKSAASVS